MFFRNKKSKTTNFFKPGLFFRFKKIKQQNVDIDAEDMHTSKQRKLRKQRHTSKKIEVMATEKKVGNLHIVRKKGVFTVSSSEKKNRKNQRKKISER